MICLVRSIPQPSLSGLEEVLSLYSFIDYDVRFVKYITAYAVITKLKITNI